MTKQKDWLKLYPFDEGVKEQLREDVRHLINQHNQEKSLDKDTARRCLEFQGFHCKNKDCKNMACPLNKMK